MLRDHRETPSFAVDDVAPARKEAPQGRLEKCYLGFSSLIRQIEGRLAAENSGSCDDKDCGRLGDLVEEARNEVEQILTLEQANELHLRELDAKALQDEVDRVWETIESMREAQVFTEEILAREISV
jgi:hypothetical protein